MDPKDQPTTTCPHCGQAPKAGAPYCEFCGKALTAEISLPRVVDGPGFATTRTGRSVQSAELTAKARSASFALLAVGILQFIAGGLLYLAFRDNFINAGAQATLTILMTVVFGLGVVYLGLFLWARSSPLPATIVGLAIYVTGMVVDLAFDPRSFGRGLLLKIIIIVTLSKGIQAGSQHAQLKKRMEADASR